jgi:chorismate lyase/3-hydroxybenzoate synthase
MQTTAANLIATGKVAKPADFPPPPWVANLFDGVTPRTVLSCDRRQVTVTETAHFALVSVRVFELDGLPPEAVESETATAYSAIAAELAGVPASHPVRFWNYIPNIHRASGASPSGESLDRYMVFNAGRYSACNRWLGGEDKFARLLATASGVGHTDADLVIHALATTTPGVAVENPRQVPAYRYSRRYGPRPPCFARATVLAGKQPQLLVGGTASVRGEASIHIGELSAQFKETLENMTALLRAAPGASADADLDRFTDVRVYYVRPIDLPALREMCDAAFGKAELEYIRADLCRQDLLVEIEGVARL